MKGTVVTQHIILPALHVRERIYGLAVCAFGEGFPYLS